MPELSRLHYNVTPNHLWVGRLDTLPEERLFQFFSTYNLYDQQVDEIKESLLLIGFESDEGVRRNFGRTGAKEGPNVIRQQLANMAYQQPVSIADLGNISCQNNDLETAQYQLSGLIEKCHSFDKKTIVLGGGHEVAWPHFKGLSSNYDKIGIINFDAHFDLRPLLNDAKATSGTGFLQIAHHCQEKNTSFDYCCLGIQEHANTHQLFKTAEKLGVSYLAAPDMHSGTLAKQITFIDQFMSNHNHLYLSICLDVFAQAFAPGVSAPQATGITPWQAQPLLKYILQTGKVVALDIAELSPPLDHDDMTARLAAVLLTNLIKDFKYSKRSTKQ